MGYLTAEETAWLEGLAWPQTHETMVGTFGKANRSTETADLYIDTDTGREIWVFYEGDSATGYQIE